MRHLLPPLHEGHAPIVLHYAFEEALDAFEAWRPGQPEPSVDCDGQPTAISAVFGRMRSCTDILPVRILEEIAAALDEPALAEFTASQTTYAEAARILRALCVERLKT
ncbi:MAG: hypothetical protein ABWZ57_11405 [Mesorhizobium sp.]|jgi:hypothetical protein